MNGFEFDYYQLLGIKPTATADEIRHAYRRLARRCHPDSNPEWENDQEANRQMARLNEAYATLRDPERRAEYDRWRWERIQQQMQQARYYEQARTQPVYQNVHEQTHTWMTGRQTEPGFPGEQPQEQSQLVFVSPVEVWCMRGITLLFFP